MHNVPRAQLLTSMCLSSVLQFFEYQESTIGAAFLTQTVQLPDCVVKFEIWDTAGQVQHTPDDTA